MSLLAVTSGDIASGVVSAEAEGVDFDGTYDYLSRSTDLVGNADSKTFTFSAWVYDSDTTTSYIYITETGTTVTFYVYRIAEGNYRIRGYNSAGTIILEINTGTVWAVSTWFNIIISIDLTSVSNRYVYINDKIITPTWTVYSNDFIDFTTTSHCIGSRISTPTPHKGRLSNIFLDYTYRALSIEANRRLFITADGKPADGQGLVDKYLDNLATGAYFDKGIAISPDGSKLFAVESGGDNIARYNITSFNFNNAVDSGVYRDITDQEPTPYAIAFSSDGTKMFASGLNKIIYQYNLATAWLHTSGTQSTNFSVASQVTGALHRFTFSSDGLTMYALDYTTRIIHQYTLQIAFDLSGGVVYTNKSINLSSDILILESMTISSDGLNILVVDSYSIIKYNLSAANDISTAVKDTRITLSLGIIVDIQYMNLDTELAVLASNKVYNVSFGVKYDISTAVYGLPANTPTAPILYLPMKDSATAHINEGTGGNFVANGTFATSNRGANQDNCVASYFDGSADYLSSTGLSGLVANKTLTFSFIVKRPINETIKPFGILNTAGTFYGTNITITNNGIDIQIYGASGNLAFRCTASSIATNILQSINLFSLSFDLSSSLNRKVFINGTDITAGCSFPTYVNENLYLSATNDVKIGTDFDLDPYYTMVFGELYFDTKYIDLATSNPFWDSETNKPIPVRKVIADTGVTPLIAMPLDASNAGKNYGSGGDFTANSAPYVGARGASEFWARSADFGSNLTKYLYKTEGLSGLSSTYTWSISFWIKLSTTDAESTIFSIGAGTFYITIDTNEWLQGTVGSGTYFTCTSNTISRGVWHHVLITRYSTTGYMVYVDGVSFVVSKSGTASSFSTNTYATVGARWTGSGYTGVMNAIVSNLYFTTDYIDFSQEVNRLKFVDGLGYPLDLSKQIEASEIPTPLIYLPFDDTTNLGKNLGTGGDFTISGTVTAGADVLG